MQAEPDMLLFLPGHFDIPPKTTAKAGKYL
jgi:hypothetical protein